MLETTEKGGNSIKNCLTVFQRDPLLSGAIAYNLLTDRNDIVKPWAMNGSGAHEKTTRSCYAVGAKKALFYAACRV